MPTIGCSRCPIVQGLAAGGQFPVGLSSLRLLTVHFLSQAGPLGRLPRASPVPFRGSFFTSGLHPPDATPQRLTACLYKRRGFPPITSLCFVAHPSRLPTSHLGSVESRGAGGHPLQARSARTHLVGRALSRRVLRRARQPPAWF